jgi:hypothetical protein
MTTTSHPPGPENVYDIFTGQPSSSHSGQQIIRLAPELDGLEMLYSNKLNPNKLFAIKVLCWALRRNGEVTGLIPWMNQVIPCAEISDPLEGRFEGYFDPGIDEVFYEAPIHKIVELETAAEYYEFQSDNPHDVVQEIPDTLGTHAVFGSKDAHNLFLTAIISWQLHNDGSLHGMVIDEKQCTETPVLPGDPCLYSASAKSTFRYYFQHHIANKIKARDPEALAAIAMLVEKELAPNERGDKKSADIISVDKNKPT